MRRVPDQPAGEREIEAERHFREPGCKPPLSAFFPGLGQMSCGRRGEGATLAILGAAELGTALAAGAARGFDSAAAEVPPLAYADLLTASTIDLVLDAQRAERLFIDRKDRLKYLYSAVPFITLLGGYLGLTYRWSGYGLSTPVAVHFWYDFLIEAVDFLADPKNSPLSMRLGFSF